MRLHIVLGEASVNGEKMKKYLLTENTIQKFAKEFAKKLGIDATAKVTNHSLRATVATLLYRENIDEQFISFITKHRSLNGLRCYKRTHADHVDKVFQKHILPSDTPNSSYLVKRTISETSSQQTCSQEGETAKKKQKTSPPSSQEEVSLQQIREIIQVAPNIDELHFKSRKYTLNIKYK